MKSSIKLRRSLIGTATALALILTAAAALPTQAAQLTDSLRTRLQACVRALLWLPPSPPLPRLV